jgi:hypothetical protein
VNKITPNVKTTGKDEEENGDGEQIFVLLLHYHQIKLFEWANNRQRYTNLIIQDLQKGIQQQNQKVVVLV